LESLEKQEVKSSEKANELLSFDKVVSTSANSNDDDIFRADEGHKSKKTAVNYRNNFRLFLKFIKIYDLQVLLDLGKEAIQGEQNKRLRLVDPKGNNLSLSELIDKYLANPMVAFKEPSKENNHNHEHDHDNSNDNDNNGSASSPLKNNLQQFPNNVPEESSTIEDPNEPNGGNYERKGFTNMWICKDCDLTSVEYVIVEHRCPAWPEKKSKLDSGEWLLDK
jgi:hypothetical protein